MAQKKEKGILLIGMAKRTVAIFAVSLLFCALFIAWTVNNRMAVDRVVMKQAIMEKVAV